MEPLSITAMISGIVSFIGARLSKNKSMDDLFDKLTNRTSDWLRSKIFKSEAVLSDDVENLKNNPESTARKKQLEAKLEADIEDFPESELFIKELFEKLKEVQGGAQVATQVINSKNVVTAPQSAGRDINIGDTNNK